MNMTSGKSREDRLQTESRSRLSQTERDRVLRKEKKDRDDKEEEKGNFYGKLVKHGLSSLTTNMVIGAVAEGVTAAELPEGATVLSEMPPLEGEVIAGPVEGGGFLERPMAGAMADAALEQSLELDYADGGSIATGADSGILTVNGNSISIPDYMPGSDIAKIATGQALDAGDGLSMLIEQGIGAGTRGAMLRSTSDTDEDTEEGSASGGSSGGSGGSDDGRTSERVMGIDNPLVSQPYAAGQGKAETKEAKEQREEQEHHEVQIEKQSLELKHRAELEEGLRTQDLGVTVTERSGKHGNLRLETQFEARHPDNSLEIKKGDEHVTDVMRSPNSSTRMDSGSIHLLSFLQEQEKENDKGLSRF